MNSQIGREIDYFCSYYQNLFPSVFLSYEREAYYALDGSDFRITFDENILSRNTELSFDRGIYGTPLLENKMTLMEVRPRCNSVVDGALAVSKQGIQFIVFQIWNRLL